METFNPNILVIAAPFLTNIITNLKTITAIVYRKNKTQSLNSHRAIKGALILKLNKIIIMVKTTVCFTVPDLPLHTKRRAILALI